jgi:uncharacterized protein (TIGR02466 family)
MLEVKMFFPTTVGIDKNVFSEKENNLVANRCYEINKTIDFKFNTWLSGEKSPENSCLQGNFIEDEGLDFMSKKIYESVHNFALAHSDNAQYFCSSSWFNIYKRDNFQESHTHAYPCMYSVVYFPLAPPNSGKLVFEPPHEIYINDDGVTEDNFLNQKMAVITPEPGMVVVFKSNLRHFVLPGTNDSDRISIAFNFILDPQFYFDKYSKNRRKNGN